MSRLSAALGQPNTEAGVLRQLVHSPEMPNQRAPVLEVPIGNKAQVTSGGQVAGALLEQATTGIVVHCVLQVEGWITEHQLCLGSIVPGRPIALVKVKCITCLRKQAGSIGPGRGDRHGGIIGADYLSRQPGVEAAQAPHTVAASQVKESVDWRQATGLIH
jgi:hypothetical protein